MVLPVLLDESSNSISLCIQEACQHDHRGLGASAEESGPTQAPQTRSLLHRQLHKDRWAGDSHHLAA